MSMPDPSPQTLGAPAGFLYACLAQVHPGRARSCHAWVTDHPAEAIRLGYSYRRHGQLPEVSA